MVRAEKIVSDNGRVRVMLFDENRPLALLTDEEAKDLAKQLHKSVRSETKQHDGWPLDFYTIQQSA